MVSNTMNSKPIKQGPRAGSSVIWPKGIEDQLDLSAPTRWRMERDGRLPPRDVFIAGKAVGWKPSTIEAMLAGKLTGAAA